MEKTIEEYFRDWESNTFGYGYGSGEPHTIAALKGFMELCDEGSLGHSYDYRRLEDALTPPVAWLLINILCNHNVDVVEYGSSPRFAWLTPKGERIKAFVAAHTIEQLLEIVCGHNESYVECYPDVCNCDDEYEEGKKCPNPFWTK